MPFRTTMLAVVQIALLIFHNSASAQPAGVRPLSYQELRDVAKWAVEQKQLRTDPPELFSTESPSGMREYLVLLGNINVRDAFPFADYEAESIFKTQVKLEQFRQRWTRDEALYSAVAQACDKVEELQDQVLRLTQQKIDTEGVMARIELIETTKGKIWQTLHDAISNWAREKGCRFIGFGLSSRTEVWQPGTRVPFDQVRPRAAGLPIEGPDGVEVRIMPNLRRKLFEIRKTPRENWDWNITFVLKSSEPSFAFVEAGGIYFMSARIGEKVRDSEFHVQPTDKKIRVILPTK